MENLSFELYFECYMERRAEVSIPIPFQERLVFKTSLQAAAIHSPMSNVYFKSPLD